MFAFYFIKSYTYQQAIIIRGGSIMARRIFFSVILGLVLLSFAGTGGTAVEELSCQLFPTDNIWNTPVDTLPVDANSNLYINTIGADGNVHADFGSGLWDGGPIGIPYTTVPGNQPKVDVSFDYDDESDPGPYPIPEDATIEGGDNSDGDRHVLVVDRDNCILYELYDAHPQKDGSWTAGSGAIFDLNSHELREAGWTSADAAGLPILPGLVRYEEVAAGEINHALRFTVPQTRKEYIWPARHYASSLTGTKYPPMGQRFRLKAGFDTSGFSPEVQVILRALKKYGMILADNGSSWYISGVPNERWDNDTLRELHDVKGSNFEAVDESSLMIDPDSGRAKQSDSGQPVILLDRSKLIAGAVAAGPYSGEQTFSISNSGSGTLTWTVKETKNWMSLSPTSGTGDGAVTVSIHPSSLEAGTYTGTITVSDDNASNSPQSVIVTLTVYPAGGSGMPFGTFETPVDGSTVMSSIPVTGWALDAVGVESVKIYRETVTGEGSGLVYIGDALFVEGARPDVESDFPGYPFNYRAGWGYMMLTNFLPDGGNGTFVLHAVAENVSGEKVTVGTKQITCDNVHAVKPFGAIDTPVPGGTAGGNAFRNMGWVLTPPPNKIPVNGSTINVYIDGVNLGHPTYNQYREDIAALFPGYENSNGALAYFDIDLTEYSNGVHTIVWSATDDDGNTDGIGSRYFNIRNTSGDIRAANENLKIFTGIPADNSLPVEITRGFIGNQRSLIVYPEDDGTVAIIIRELELLTVKLFPDHNTNRNCVGYGVVGGGLRSLPVGSSLDKVKGIFRWQPGPGYIGPYRFEFILTGFGEEIKRKILVTIVPMHSNN
jgi:hypothetical protein